MSIQPFNIHIPQATLDDLRERLVRTRWPDEVEGAGWDYGTNLQYMKEFVAYWQHTYDWRKQEAELNTFAQFKAEIDGKEMHFIHERGKGPNPTPILLIHGWPDSFYRMHKILPLAQLMTDVLGYRRYAAAGGDIGSRVARLLALAHPEFLVGIHLTDIGFPREIAFPPDLSNPSRAEQQFLGSVQGWFMQEGAYAMLQSTKPLTLAYGLNDSPVGLAGWIVEKFRAWSDCGGDIEQRFSKDELLTNIMIYWVTETISSSARLYYEDGRMAPQLQAGQHIDVPAAVAIFPKDLTQPPRELGKRFLRVERWTEMPRGGHFAALEEPELLVDDIRAFFHDLKAKN